MKKSSRLIIIYCVLTAVIIGIGIYRISVEFSLPHKPGEVINWPAPKHTIYEYKSYLLTLRQDLSFENQDHDLILYPENQSYAAVSIPKEYLDQIMDVDKNNKMKENYQLSLNSTLNSLTYSAYFHNKLDPIFSKIIGIDTQYKFHLIFRKASNLEVKIVADDEKSMMNSIFNQEHFAVFISLLIDEKTLDSDVNLEETYNCLFSEIKEMFNEFPDCYYSLSAAVTKEFNKYRYIDIVNGIFGDDDTDFYGNIWTKP